MELRTHESREIPISRLNEPPLPSRTTMDDDKLQQLADDIARRGVIQHLIVFPVEDRYEIVAGHRRYTAAKMAGLLTVPCDVYPSRAAADEGMQWAENEFRERLLPADEALWLDDLLTQKCGGDVDALCARLKRPRAGIENRLDLIYRGHKDVFEALQRKQITVGVAEQLNKCTNDDHRRYLLDLARHEEWTVGRAVSAIRDWKLYREPATANAAPPSSETPIAPMVDDYFTCLLCEQQTHTANMRPRQLHDFCEKTILEPALDFYRNRRDYLRAPRTLEEATELVNDLCDRFPALAGEPAPTDQAARR